MVIFKIDYWCWLSLFVVSYFQKYKTTFVCFFLANNISSNCVLLCFLSAFLLLRGKCQHDMTVELRIKVHVCPISSVKGERKLSFWAQLGCRSMKIVHSLADVALEQAHMIVLGQWNEGRERKWCVALFLLSALISFAFTPFSGPSVGLISAVLWTTETLTL